MNILLIMPPEKKETLVHTTPPFSLLQLAAALQGAGHQVKILDFFTFGLAEQELEESLRTFHPAVVGITGMSCHHTEMISLARKVKEQSAATVAVGGFHASALPELLLKEDAIDVLFRGEADETFPEYLCQLTAGNPKPDLPGLCFKRDRQLVIKDPAVVADIDRLPFPAWSLLPPTLYKGAPHGFFYRRWPIGLILSSRGCPFKCTFCSAACVSLRKWRAFSPERVLREIHYLVNTYGVKEIQFIDDNFTLNRERAKEICRLIIRDKLDHLAYSCPNGVRLDTLDEELLDLLKQAGFYSFSLGLESGSQRVLDRIKKDLNLGKVARIIKSMKRRGFQVTGFFIVGFPFETTDDIKETINYALRLKLDGAAFTMFIPLPGSEEFDLLVKSGKINLETHDWARREWVEGVQENIYDHLTADQVKEFQKKATMRFYLRPHILARQVVLMLAHGQFKNLLTAAKRFAGYTLRKG